MEDYTWGAIITVVAGERAGDLGIFETQEPTSRPSKWTLATYELFSETTT